MREHNPIGERRRFRDKILMEPLLPTYQQSWQVVKSQFYDPYKIDELSTTRDP